MFSVFVDVFVYKQQLGNIKSPFQEFASPQTLEEWGNTQVFHYAHIGTAKPNCKTPHNLRSHLA
jgi:hypothetical protein